MGTAKQNKTLRKVAKNSKIMVVVSNLGPPEAGIVIQEAGVQTYINEKNLGKGKLYISEARVSWVGDAGHTFSLEYNHIALHAVSRDVTAFPNAENLYLMIDVKLVDSEPSTPRSTPETSDDEDQESGEGMTEVRFVPDDKSKLQEMFNAMSRCQALHPDPEAAEDQEDEELDGDDEEFEDDGDEGIYDDAEEENGSVIMKP